LFIRLLAMCAFLESKIKCCICDYKCYFIIERCLSRFSEKDIQVIAENEEFLSIHQYLSKELRRIESGDAEFIEVDQLEKEIEATIRKHEAKST